VIRHFDEKRACRALGTPGSRQTPTNGRRSNHSLRGELRLHFWLRPGPAFIPKLRSFLSEIALHRPYPIEPRSARASERANRSNGTGNIHRESQNRQTQLKCIGSAGRLQSVPRRATGMGRALRGSDSEGSELENCSRPVHDGGLRHFGRGLAISSISDYPLRCGDR
jgi:hypothetical protein